MVELWFQTLAIFLRNSKGFVFKPMDYGKGCFQASKNHS